jgi:hypothetical protein
MLQIPGKDRFGLRLSGACDQERVVDPAARHTFFSRIAYRPPILRFSQTDNGKPFQDLLDQKQNLLGARTGRNGMAVIVE